MITSTPHPEYPWIYVHVRKCARGHEMQKRGGAVAPEFPACPVCDAARARAARRKAKAEGPAARAARKQAREAKARRRRFGPSGAPELDDWMEPVFAAVMVEHDLSLEALLAPSREPRFVAARRDLAKRLHAAGATMTQIGRAIRRDWATCRALVHGVRR